jgi:hypothetical protein
MYTMYNEVQSSVSNVVPGNLHNCNSTLQTHRVTQHKMAEYMNLIFEKAYDRVLSTFANITIAPQDIPTTANYGALLTQKYMMVDLKRFAKHYNLKLSGSKKDLTFRICSHLYFSSFIVKIQKVFRGRLQRMFSTQMHGPAYLNRALCVNQTDFLSMEEVALIPLHQFFSYKDVDGFIYGFDIVSLHNLITKSGSKLCNPYNRNSFPPRTLYALKSLLSIGKLLNMNINTEIEVDNIIISSDKSLELRILALFQNINALGNYSEPKWFAELDKNKLLKFVRELYDIWNYRLQISNQMKTSICPPHGNPFRQLNFQELREVYDNNVIKGRILSILECLVNSGVDRDSKCLGAYYVLGALTIVNAEAATSLPWLYQSVTYY